MLYFSFQWVVTLAYNGANVDHINLKLAINGEPLESAYVHRVKFNKFSYNGVLLYFALQLMFTLAYRGATVDRINLKLAVNGGH